MSAVRCVSLCPSLTETVFALGRGAWLVGRTRYCIAPAGLVESVEVVGGTKDPDLARIRVLGPDRVLLSDEENRREDYEALIESGIETYVTAPRSVEDAALLLRELGALLEAEERGEELACDVEQTLAHWRGRGGGSFVYLCWRKPWMAAGRDTFISAMLEAVGGRNALSDEGRRYPTLTPGRLAALNPDHVLLSSEPYPFREEHGRELAGASGIPLERFQCVDGQLLSWYGARTPAGIPHAARILGARRAHSD